MGIPVLRKSARLRPRAFCKVDMRPFHPRSLAASAGHGDYEPRQISRNRFKRFRGFPKLRQLRDREVINACGRGLWPPSLRQIQTRVGRDDPSSRAQSKKRDRAPNRCLPVAARSLHWRNIARKSALLTSDAGRSPAAIEATAARACARPAATCQDESIPVPRSLGRFGKAFAYSSSSRSSVRPLCCAAAAIFAFRSAAGSRPDLLCPCTGWPQRGRHQASGFLGFLS
jgi:hypothetical protein